MGEYKKSAEFQALIDKYQWIKLSVSVLESDGESRYTSVAKAKQYQRLLGTLDFLAYLAMSKNSGDDGEMIVRVYSEVKTLYSEYENIFTAPVSTGDILYDVCPPDDAVPAVICPCKVEEVSDKHIFIDNVPIPHKDVGRTIFKTRKEAEDYIRKMWGE